MLFVTKCPCDECVPLISGAGITHIYTSDQDRDKVKVDISYLRFSSLRNISKYIVSPQTGGMECPAAGAVDAILRFQPLSCFCSTQWQRNPSTRSPSSPPHASKFPP